ncbi:MAG: DUF6133 family protein [Peptostreptococcaceae bacterium]
MTNLFVKGFLVKEKVKNTLVESLTSKKGEGYVDTGVKVLMAVVLGALVLGALYALFKTIIIPKMNSSVTGMFDYKG